MLDGTEYLRKTAQRCFALAGRCYHLEVARDLRRLGDELADKAAQVAAAERAARDAVKSPSGEAACPERAANDSGCGRRRRAIGRRHQAIAKLADIAARVSAVFGMFDHRRGAPSRWSY